MKWDKEESYSATKEQAQEQLQGWLLKVALRNGNYYMEIHDKTFPFIAASQKIYPDSEAILDVDYCLDFSTV